MTDLTTITGNLGADAELRFTTKGAPVLNMRVAQKVDDRTDWYRVSVWDDMAETLAGVLVKGAQVTATGVVTERHYESASGGGVALEMNARAIGWRKPKVRPAEPTQQDPWAADEPPAEVPGW